MANKENPFYVFMGRSVSNLSSYLLNNLNEIKCFNLEEYQKTRTQNNGRGLLTYSNHIHYLDDPLITMSLDKLVFKNLNQDWYKGVRWIAADSYNFFSNPIKGKIYSTGKCVPVFRGDGPDQRGMDFLEERLKAGDWIHVFPEGGRTKRKDHLLDDRFKSGISKLIYLTNPIILPYYHFGIQNILARGQYLPKTGQQITIHFGKSFDLSKEIVEHQGDWHSFHEKYKRFLREKLEKLQNDSVGF